MLRIGLIGCGHIGTVHSFALRQLADGGLIDADITATFDTDPERALKLAEPNHAVPAKSLGALLDAVDVAWICTWTDGHLPAVEAAVARDLPVFCEKPLAPNLADCRRIAELLAGVPHQVGLVLRHAPVFGNLARIVHSGRFGKPMALILLDDQYFPIQGMYGSTWRADVGKAGGGTLIEHSIHDLDVINWVMGRPDSVSAHTASIFGYPGIDDSSALRLAYPGGATASLVSVWHQVTSRPSTRRLELFCEHAFLWTEDDYLGPLHVETSDGRRDDRGRPAGVDRPVHGPGGAGQAVGPVRRTEQSLPGRPGRGRGRGPGGARGRGRPRGPRGRRRGVPVGRGRVVRPGDSLRIRGGLR